MERHACLTPIWSETAHFADYVLPMGHASERHDLMSQETHAARWIGFRQPVLRVALEKQGQRFDWTWQAHEAAGLGQVWEEDEFWIELSWRIDPDGALGIRKYFESPYRPGEKLRIEEFYRWIFESSVPGLPAAAQKEGLTPLAYMRKYGAFLVEEGVYATHEKAPSAAEREGAQVDPVTRVVTKGGAAVGVEIDGRAAVGFPTPSRKLEFYSKTLKDWKWPEHAVPTYARSHVHWSEIDRARGEMLLLPTFRLPNLIHSRSGNSKWLYEISHTNPLWLHPEDAGRLGVTTGDLLKIETEIGYFVDRVWMTEAIRPGVLACSHHLGRWRLQESTGGERWSTALVDLRADTPGKWRMRHLHGVRPFDSTDGDSQRVWWEDAGVHQNLTFPVHPDPVSGQHCWHQKVRAVRPTADERYGDVFVDTDRAHEVYRRWLALTRPAPGPGGCGGRSGCHAPSSPTPPRTGWAVDQFRDSAVGWADIESGQPRLRRRRHHAGVARSLCQARDHPLRPRAPWPRGRQCHPAGAAGPLPHRDPRDVRRGVHQRGEEAAARPRAGRAPGPVGTAGGQRRVPGAARALPRVRRSVSSSVPARTRSPRRCSSGSAPTARSTAPTSSRIPSASFLSAPGTSTRSCR